MSELKMDPLDESSLAGDGVADTAVGVTCPYCGAEVDVKIDPGGGETQRYVEDCEVCCQPWQLTVRWNALGTATVEALTDEA